MNRRNFVKMFGASAVAIHASSLRALTKDHVVVAGAGIMGASIAYHLAKRGARVTLLEKERPAAGTTQNSFAWLNASGKSPRTYYDLNLGGMMGWRRLELELGRDVLPVQWGGAVQWAAPNTIRAKAMEPHVKERALWGYPMRMVDEQEFRALLPMVTPGPYGAGTFADLEGTVDPVVAADALVSAAKAHGATVMYPCEVKELVLGQGKVTGVKTTQGTIGCDYVVVAAGNGTPEIAAQAGVPVPLVESRGIIAHSTPNPMIVNRVVLTPGGDTKQNFDGRVLVGADFGDSGNAQPTPELGYETFARAAKYIPALSTLKLDYMTLGHRVMPKDGHPIIGRGVKYPNLHVAAQHSGMTCSPYVGQMVASEVLDQIDIDVLTPYRPQRFA